MLRAASIRFPLIAERWPLATKRLEREHARRKTADSFNSTRAERVSYRCNGLLATEILVATESRTRALPPYAHAITADIRACARALRTRKRHLKPFFASNYLRHCLRQAKDLRGVRTHVECRTCRSVHTVLIAFFAPDNTAHNVLGAVLIAHNAFCMAAHFIEIAPRKEPLLYQHQSEGLSFYT